MKVFGVLSFLLVAFTLLAPCTASCNASCLAYEWALPLWKMLNIRYLQAGSITFSMNHLAFKRSNALNAKSLALCTQSLCAGSTSLLNPSPIVSPNVDTLYGDAWLDFQPGRCWNLTIPDASTNKTSGTLRWYGVTIVDMWTNTELVIDASSNPTGGSFCLCPSGTAANCGAGFQNFTNLTQYGQLLLRTWSSGAATTGNTACGADGCNFLLAMNFALSKNSTTYTALNPRTGFSNYMSSSSQCPYYWNSGGWVPCGPSGNKTNFWQAVCLGLSQNPLTQSYQTDEAAYVNANFASLGINSNACSASPSYAALNFGLANAANSGFWNIAQNFTKASYSKGPWQFLYYSNHGAQYGSAFWGSDYFGRGSTATRLHLQNANEKSVYYTAFQDSSFNTLSGASSATYKVTFTQDFPIGPAGFWSLTVYDQTNFMFANSLNRWAIKGATATAPSEIHLANACNTSNPMCIPVPAATFNIMLRGYIPTAAFIVSDPGFNYQVPSIVKCTTAAPCK